MEHGIKPESNPTRVGTRRWSSRLSLRPPLPTNQTHSRPHTSSLSSFIFSASPSSESDAFSASALRRSFVISSASSSNESDAFAAPILSSVFQLPLRPHFLIHLMHSRPQLRQFRFAHFCTSFASSILACGPLDPGRRIFVSGAAQRTRHFEPDPSRISGVGSFSSASSLASSSASGMRTR